MWFCSSEVYKVLFGWRTNYEKQERELEKMSLLTSHDSRLNVFSFVKGIKILNHLDIGKLLPQNYTHIA